MSFTFTAAAATGSAAAGATSGSVTPWYRLSERSAASSFLISGTFVAALQPEYSNVADFDKGTDYAPDAATYTAPTLRELPLGIGDFFRMRCTSFGSGTPKLSLAKALGPDKIARTIQEDTKKTPAPSSVGPNN